MFTYLETHSLRKSLIYNDMRQERSRRVCSKAENIIIALNNIESLGAV